MFRFKKLTLFIFLINLSVSTSHAQMTQALPGFGLPLLQQTTFIKPLEANTIIHFTVWLKLRNKEQFDKLTRELYDPSSTRYRKFLKPGEFDKDYAPSQEVENTVLHYFSAQGMQAKIVNHSIRVTASAQQIQQTLKVKMNYYHFKNKIVYANASAPIIKSDIAQYISEISGLNNIASFTPALIVRPNFNNHTFKPHDINLVWDSFTPDAQPTTTSFAGFTGAQLQTTYNLANIPPVKGTSINGAGQTLVIIDACGNNSAAQIKNDANNYNSANGITLFSSSNFIVINPDGTPFTTCAHPGSSWDNEIALDVESSHTIAPGANTVLVLAQSDTGPLDTAVNDVINTLITNNYTIGGFPNAYVVSNSWGISETSGSSPAMETHLETAAAHGINFDFSSSDCGDGTYSSSWPCTSAGVQPSVQYPASSAYTTAVGGSSLFVDNNWNYAFESLWGNYFSGSFYAGSTGGISQFYGPVSWQSSISNFTAGGYTSGTIGTYNMRAVPDIAMLADPYTGLTIYQGGSFFVYGGTSLACPLFSATVTLLNQERALLNGGTANPIGQVAPFLYTQNSALINGQALRLIVPPHQIISGATFPPAGAPISAFKIHDSAYGYDLTFGWDSSLTIAPENQFWNDGVGIGSPYLPNFLAVMSTF